MYYVHSGSVLLHIRGGPIRGPVALGGGRVGSAALRGGSALGRRLDQLPCRYNRVDEALLVLCGEPLVQFLNDLGASESYK